MKSKFKSKKLNKKRTFKSKLLKNSGHKKMFFTYDKRKSKNMIKQNVNNFMDMKKIN